MYTINSPIFSTKGGSMSRYVINNVALVLKALKYSEKYHKGQFRNGSGDPYFYHPFTVSLILASFKHSKHLSELICAALMHDCLEDTELTFGVIAREFTPLVATLVQELTNDDVEIAKVGKLEYHKKKLIGISSYALYIKLADRLHNVSDNPTSKMVGETLELMSHLLKNRKLSKNQNAIVAEIIRVCNQ